MKVGDKLESRGEYKEIYSQCGYSLKKNILHGRIVKKMEGVLFQLEGDQNLWFYIKDFEDEPQYEIY